MKSLKLKRILLCICFMLIASSFLSCKLTSKDKYLDAILDYKDLSPVNLSFYIPGTERTHSKMVLGEVAKRSNLNITLDFIYVGTPNTYKNLIRQLSARRNPIDGFYVSRLGNDDADYSTMARRGQLKDITELFPKLAPNIYKKLSKEDIKALTVDGKIYAVPNLLPFATTFQVCVRQDFMKKYNILKIKTLEDYEVYLKTVKEKEKDIIPGESIYPNASFFARAYGYVMLDENTGLVYKLSDSNMKIIPWEQTPEFREAVGYVARWYKNGYLRRPNSDKDKDVASCIRRTNAALPSDGTVKVKDPYNPQKTYEFYAFHLYGDKPIVKLGIIGNAEDFRAIAFDTRSNNVDRALMLLNWIQSDKDNYELFTYGIKGKTFDTTFGAMTLPKGADSNNPPYFPWWNGPFQNFEYETPSNLVPSSFKKNIEEFYKTKAISIPHEGFFPDYSKVQDNAKQRSSILISKVYNSLYNGLYDDNNTDSIINELKAAGTDRIVFEIQQQLDAWIRRAK